MRIFIAFLVAALSCLPANAQNVNINAATGTVPNLWQPVSAANPLPTTPGTGSLQNVNVTQWASAALGAMANYGTSPGAVLVPGMNAFVTNVNSNGSATSANSSPVVIASDQAAVAVKTSDPCTSATKSSTAISVTSATTTSLVAVSGSTTVYVCGFSMTIAPSGTSADTALFEYGTGAACSTPTTLTGTFGNGDLTTTTGVAAVSYGNGSATIFKSAASAGVCILTAGTTVNVQGVLTWVQQ